MSKWFPDMSTEQGIESGAKAGCYGGIAFGCMSLLGMIVFYFAGQPPGEASSAIAGRIGGMVAIGLEAAIALTAAYRFRHRKGLVIGAITIGLFLFEIASKLMADTFRPGWGVVDALVLIGLVNGWRAAWSARKMGNLGDAPLEGIFD